MARDNERQRRATEKPIVGGLPEVPGIGAALSLTPGLGTHLRALADELLVNDFPGATISRGERELLAAAVSAGNDCFFCMDSHGAFAAELLARAGVSDGGKLVDAIKAGGTDSLGPKMVSLLGIARRVGADARALTREEVSAALSAGASDADTQLAVLIAAAFSMYNRMVDGFRAATPPTADAFAVRAKQIADAGYSAPPPGKPTLR